MSAESAGRVNRGEALAVATASIMLNVCQAAGMMGEVSANVEFAQRSVATATTAGVAWPDSTRSQINRSTPALIETTDMTRPLSRNEALDAAEAGCASVRCAVVTGEGKTQVPRRRGATATTGQRLRATTVAQSSGTPPAGVVRCL